MTKFNPADFRVAEVKSIALGNSQHPVMEYIVGDSLKKIPSKELKYQGVFYVALKSDKGVMTYMGGSYPSLQLHKVSFEEFKQLVKANQPLPQSCEVVDCVDTNKYIGNDVMEYLRCEEML